MKLSELSKALDLPLHGNPDHIVDQLASVGQAQPSDLAFVVGKKYVEQLTSCKAGAVIVPPNMLDDAPGNCLVSENPYDSYAAASWLLTPERKSSAGVHASASIAKTASIGKDVSVGANVVIGENVVVGDGVSIGANSVIDDNVHIGANTRLFANVTIYHGCKLGVDCRLQSGAVIGAEGFGYSRNKKGWQPIHQTGGVLIGDRVHVGANTCIDRGAINDTRIGDDVILDNHIQIAHNVQLGQFTAIAACVGIAGSTVVGKNCQIGGATSMVGHISIADNVIISAGSFVARTIDEPGRYGSGTPLLPISTWRRTFVSLGKLDELVKRVRRLETQPK